MDEDLEVTLVNNLERERYEALIGGRPAAYSTYEMEPGRVVITHTVVRPQFEGRGVGSRLAKFAVDDIRDRGLRIKPVCKFTQAWLRKHPEHDPIVDYPNEERISSP